MGSARLEKFLLLALLMVPFAGRMRAQAPPARHAAKQQPAHAGRAVPLPPSRLIQLLRQKVKYVFVIYQENRSFDSYFGTFPGAEGLFSHPAAQTPGFTQTLIDTDGKAGVIRPFRIGPYDECPKSLVNESASAKCYAADTDDIDHSHVSIVAKMNIQGQAARMDRFALAEEIKYGYNPKDPASKPSLKAKQFGELAMAYEDCDTIPLLWGYADKFVLFDHIFQTMTGPSTPGNLAIIGAQSGQTQWELHPEQHYPDNGTRAPGVPVLNDNDPFWGSPSDRTAKADKMPVNPHDYGGPYPYGTQLNLTYATIPLTLAGGHLNEMVKSDADPENDLEDVKNDVTFISGLKRARLAFAWYEEGYGKEPTDPDDAVDANGTHASYITHHNGPQYFGYVSNNPVMRSQLHSLDDFFQAVTSKALPRQGGVFFVKGGSENIFKLAPADPDSKVQQKFKGDDDHPAYSDAQISEAMVAEAINRIAASPYWAQSAIIVTWDDSEGDYDHVPPPLGSYGPDQLLITHGPRVPLIVLSPYARTHYISHDPGSHSSVIKFVDTLFNLPRLALLPDELRGRKMGEQKFGQKNLGPEDALTPGISDLLEAFSPSRLTGKAAPLTRDYVRVSEALIQTLPEHWGFSGCQYVEITPTDRQPQIKNVVPGDFNPRPSTNPNP